MVAQKEASQKLLYSDSVHAHLCKYFELHSNVEFTYVRFIKTLIRYGTIYEFNAKLVAK